MSSVTSAPALRQAATRMPAIMPWCSGPWTEIDGCARIIASSSAMSVVADAMHAEAITAAASAPWHASHTKWPAGQRIAERCSRPQ